ncbi:MAG TPA: GNAT family N-acetyltransferase [Candidatus Dormibacteraeota bacterium]
MRVLPGELSFRPGAVEDGRLIADVHTAEFGDDPWDPHATGIWYADPDQVWARFRSFAGEEPVGFATCHHTPWKVADDGFVWLLAGFFPAHRTPANLGAAYAFLEARAHERSGRTAIAGAREDDSLLLQALEARGYVEDRRDRFWELDLVAGRTRLLEMARRSRERMREQGITLTTIGADGDPEKYRKLHAMSSEAEMDVPTTTTTVPPSLERLMEWLGQPTIHQDRFWIARIGDQVAGLSTLAFPVERGIVGTDWTAVGRAHRNRGIARALKLETIAQAIELGVDRVRTDNDSTNAPILHLNAELGYRRVFDRLALTRSLA